jgi:DNA-binding PadR family transcriptional regulator
MDRARVDKYLPLTPTVFDILLALADSEKHGYAILQAVHTSAGGSAVLRAGTLYRALNRLLGQDLVEECARRPAASLDDERRRYYRITPLGRRVLKAELERLQQQILEARAKNLFPERS